MADLRSIALNYAGPGFSVPVVLEQPEPGFTTGAGYEILSLIVDCQPTPPKPSALMVDDTGHFKLVELAKVRTASFTPSPPVPPA